MTSHHPVKSAALLALSSALATSPTPTAFAQCNICSASAPNANCTPTPCVAQDNGSGTVPAPTFTCDFTGGRFVLRSGLPANSTIECAYNLGSFFDVCPYPVACSDEDLLNFPPPPNWTLSTADALLTLRMQGTGDLSTYQRTITIPCHIVVHLAPATPGSPTQQIETQLASLDAQLPPGDRDFDLLHLTAGNGHGLRSPGHVTLTQLPSGNWNADSFFDITYRIDLQGHPGGPLSGTTGITQGEPPVHAVSGSALSTALMNPVGSADVPAPGLPLTGNRATGGAGGTGGCCVTIVNGLPSGSSVVFQPLATIVGPANIVPGSIGGPGYQVNALLTLDGSGTGAFAGYQRTLEMPMMMECHVGQIPPPGVAVQELENVTQQMMAQLPPGDPDFDLLTITAGNGFGMPSPGHTTLMLMPDGGTWAVDSFFDITYRIDFVGHPGGPFGGMSGSTTGNIRMSQGGPLPNYEVNAFGLPHVAKTNVRIVGDSDGDLRVDNIGSSGQDGVSIMLSAVPSSGVSPLPVQLFGLQGWFGEVDFGPSGALPSGCMMRAKGTIKGGGGMGGGGSIALTLADAGGGSAGISLALDCGNPCGGTLCTCCPELCGTALTVTLYNHGVPVASNTYPSPWPDNLVTGPLGTVVGPTGLADAPTVGTFVQDTDGNGGLDRMKFFFSEPISFSGAMQLNGRGGAVQADMAVFDVTVPGLPWYPAFVNIDLTAANVAAAGPQGGPGVIVLSKEVISVGEIEFMVEKVERARMAGPGDVDGDGLPDLLVSNLGSSGNDGVRFFDPGSEPFRGFWPLPAPPLASVELELRVLDTVDGSLPPNGSVAVKAVQGFVDLTGGFSNVTFARFSRCTSGACDAVEMHVDFSGMGATTMRCEAYLNGGLVGVSTGVPGTLAATGSKETKPKGVSKDAAGTSVVDGGAPEVVTLRFAPESVQLPSGIIVVCDELRASPENAQSSPNRVLSMALTGANLCRLDVTDVIGVPIPAPPPCPADIAPPGGDQIVSVPDLLFVINHWGACQAGVPCVADIAPQPNGDGVVSVADLLFVINHWGACL